jgi:hypothetical protein
MLHLVHVQRYWDLSPRCQQEQAPKKKVPYLQHDMGRTVPAIALLKITWQAGCLAVRANVDVGRRTIDTVETGAHYVLLTTAEGRVSKDTYRKMKDPLEALDTKVFEGYQDVSVIRDKPRAAYKTHPHFRKLRRHRVRGGCGI